MEKFYMILVQASYSSTRLKAGKDQEASQSYYAKEISIVK